MLTTLHDGDTFGFPVQGSRCGLSRMRFVRAGSQYMVTTGNAQNSAKSGQGAGAPSEFQRCFNLELRGGKNTARRAEIRWRPFEVFITLGKAGGSAIADVEAMGRLISLALRSGIPIMEIHRQLWGTYQAISNSDSFISLRKYLWIPDRR